jgi:hypothetical protein
MRLASVAQPRAAFLLTYALSRPVLAEHALGARGAVGRDLIVDRDVGAPAGRVTARSLAALDAGQPARLRPSDSCRAAVVQARHPTRI